MTAPKPWAVGDMPTDVAHRSTATTMQNSDGETLTAVKEIIESTPVKAVFESVIAILTLVQVRFIVLFRFLHLLIGDATRTS